MNGPGKEEAYLLFLFCPSKSDSPCLLPIRRQAGKFATDNYVSPLKEISV